MSVAAHPATPTVGHHRHSSIPQPHHLSLAQLQSMTSPSTSSLATRTNSNGGITFTSLDAAGQNFTSPYGDLQLADPAMQAALSKRLGGGALGQAAAGSSASATGSSVSHQAAANVNTNVFQTPSGMTLAGDVSIEEDEDEVARIDEAAQASEDEDEGSDSDMEEFKSKPAKKKSAAATARRGSKSSTASSTAAAKGKTKAEGSELGDATPRPKSKAGAAAKSTNPAANGTPSKKKAPAPGCEVKGERDSLTGRRKIKIQFIEDDSRRHITFSKRKAGIMKKAYELSVLTGTQVLLLIVSQTGLVFTFTTPKLRPVVMESEGRDLIQKCLSAPDDEEEDEEGDGEETFGGQVGDDDEANALAGGGGGSDDEDEDDDEPGSVTSPPSPSKAPIAIMRPGPERIPGQSVGPTMTASGGTPKRSGGGTGDGGAAGRRSRAATISNATVRQHRNGVASPEQALTGLSLPGTPVTPSSSVQRGHSSHGSISGSTATNNRKRRRTTATDNASTTPSLTSAASAAMTSTTSSMPMNATRSSQSAPYMSSMPSPRSGPMSLASSTASAPAQSNQQLQYYRAQQQHHHQRHIMQQQQQQQQQQQSHSQQGDQYPLVDPPNSAPANMESMPMHGFQQAQIPQHFTHQPPQHMAPHQQHNHYRMESSASSTSSSASSSQQHGIPLQHYQAISSGALPMHHQHQQQHQQQQHQQQPQHSQHQAQPPNNSFLFANGPLSHATGGPFDSTSQSNAMTNASHSMMPTNVGTGATPGVNSHGGGMNGDFLFDPSCLDEIQQGKYW